MDGNVERNAGKILVVDDSEDIRELLSVTLSAHNHTVITAENGQEGVDRFFREPGIRLVITDMDMPVLNGLGLIQKLREAKADVPIIVLTGRKDVDTAIKTVHAGADDYIVKDGNIREGLLLQTRKVLEMRKIADENKRLYAQLEARNIFIKKTFGRYMSDEVVEKLLESPDGLKLGGETLKVTVMMTDLRGFSAISEACPPETVVEMLNAYLKDMTDVIAKYSGVINEIIGDALLVLFGAPAMRPDDADRALACAVEMQLAMEEVNRRNREKGIMELEMGIGINTGPVVAGNVGSDIRAKYAVVGGNVNLAGRVESFTVGGQILITESTMKETSLRVITGGELLVPFKGMEKPATLYEVTGVSGKYNLSLPEKRPAYIGLKEGLPVRYEVLEEKHSTWTQYDGAITALAEKNAVLRTGTPLAPFTNLKISLTGKFEGGREAYLYAKVMRAHGSKGHSCEVHFTFVPREIRELFSRPMK